MTMEEAEEATQDTAIGALEGFAHPIDTLYNQSGYMLTFGRELYRGDFSGIRNSSGADIARFVGVRAREAMGVAASIYSVGKLAMSAPAGIAALADTEVGLACRGFAARASSFVRKGLLSRNNGAGRGREPVGRGKAGYP